MTQWKQERGSLKNIVKNSPIRMLQLQGLCWWCNWSGNNKDKTD